MKKIITPSLLALSISTVLFPISSYSAITSVITDSGNTITYQGDSFVHGGSLVVASGHAGSAPHNVVLNDVNLSHSGITGMIYQSVVSLGGNNGALGSSGTNTWDYGDLSVTANNSTIVGSGTYASGIYARTDSLGAKTSVVTNSFISITGNTGRATGILAESFGTNGVVDITLADGSNINVDYQGVSNLGSAGIIASAGRGGYFVKAEENTVINTTGLGASGIYAVSGNLGGYIEHNGLISTTGNDSFGIYALGSSGTTGNITAINNGHIETNSSGSHAVNISNNGTGRNDIFNDGTIIASGQNSHGINSAASGQTYIENTGNIVINGLGGYGINTTSAGGNVTVINSGTITTHDNKGIYARTTSGNVVIQASNDITTGQASGTTHNHGIDAAVGTGAGNVDVYYDAGTIKVTGVNGAGGNTIGIASWDAGSGNTGVNASIHLGSTAVIDATDGVGGLQIRTNGTGVINIDKGAEVHGGRAGGYGVNIYSRPGFGDGNYELNNSGWIDSLSDNAIRVSTDANSLLTINNTGTIDGYVTMGSEDSIFNNLSSNSWNIRNYTDSGSGYRDTKGVAVSNFGGGYDVFKNEASGTVRLATVSADALTPTSASYIPAGALDITNAGIVHGHLLNLDRFENRGVIDLGANGQAGDVLLISGGAVAGTYGGGEFVADGGVIFMDVVLNDGGANSVSDILVVDDIVAGSQKTKIAVNRVGGLGSVTSGDGIKVIEAHGTSNDGAFELSRMLKGGAYEYTLHQGSLSNAADRSLFLRATARQINPDIGSYLANQTAASSMFMHSLHDRLGEPQYYQNYQSVGRTIPALWIRGSVAKTKGEAAGGNLKQDTDSNIIHMGGELADWTSDGNNRYHLGIMGAYGRAETTTTSKATGSKVDGKVDGYGVGAYFTWFSNEFAPEGWYSDVWTMYNWFDNETEGSDNYDSKSWNTSVEVGYAETLDELENYSWMLEPQAQITYNYYSSSNIKDHNGLNVTKQDADGFTTRLGMRTYLKPSKNPNGLQPFFETNWLYTSADNSMQFNNETFADGMPENRFEVKAGVQGEVINNLHLYGHVGFQWGQNNYDRTEGQIGLRYRF
jgi:autotransporter family porin